MIFQGFVLWGRDYYSPFGETDIYIYIYIFYVYFLSLFLSFFFLQRTIVRIAENYLRGLYKHRGPPAWGFVIS